MSQLRAIILEYGQKKRRIMGVTTMYIQLLKWSRVSSDEISLAELMQEKLCEGVLKDYIRKRSAIDPNFMP